MFKPLAICLIAMYVTSEPCQKGCLRCQNENNTTTKICTVCNPKGYIFDPAKDNKECKAIGEDLDNCAAYTANGTCLVCGEHYFLSDGKCVAVTTKITDCILYESLTTCTRCYNKKIIASDKLSCVTPATDKQIANCNIYSTELLCGVCVDNFALSWDAKSCVQLPTTTSDNCAVYEKFQCKECDATFFYNKNLELYNAAIGTSVTSNMVDVMTNGDDKHRGSYVQCQATLDENCIEFEAFDLCKTCKSGYYLTSTKTCQIYPLQRIDNCKVYKNATQCLACEDNFHLNESDLCKNIDPDPQGQDDHCAKYATDVKDKTCVLCEQEYYLTTGSNSCQIRIEQTITNCDALDPKADQCLTCKSGFIQNSNKKKCIQAIANCLTYNLAIDTATCSKCTAGFYLNGEVCVQGTKANCKEYQTTQNNCDLCEGRFIVPLCSNQKLEITNCKSYHQEEEEEKCTICNTNYANFRLLNKCVETYTARDNCTVYDTNGNCTTCADGFFVENNGCSALPANCKSGTSATVCTKCMPEFGINYDNKCIKSFNLHTQFCLAGQMNYDHDNTNQIDDSVCDVCESGAVNYQVEDQERVCVANQNVKDIYESATLVLDIDGCLSYDETQDPVVCTKCESNRYLSADGSSCGTCDLGAQTITAFSIDGAVTKDFNRCTDHANDDLIRVKGPSLVNKNNISLSCATGALPVVNNDYWNAVGTFTKEPQYSNIDPSRTNAKDWIQWPYHVQPEIEECHKIVAGTDLIQSPDVDQNPKSCAYFVNTDTNKFDCLRCPFGSIPQGTTEHNGYFTDCVTTNNNFSSEQYQNIPALWAYYFSVHTCTGGIPVLGMKISFTANADNNEDKFNGFAKVNYANDNDGEEWTGTSYTSPFICIDTDDADDITSKLNIPAAGTSVEAMPGCGLAVLDVGATNPKTAFNNSGWDATDTTGTNQSLQCVACKHGFKATYRTDGKFIRTCEAITNCNTNFTNITDSRKMFNGCYKCNDGYTFGWANNAVDHTQCVKIPSTQSLCQAYTRDPDNVGNTANTGNCHYCPRGYVLNQDKFCSKITFPQCADNFYPYETLGNNDNLHHKFYNQYRGQGCTLCSTGYHAQLYGGLALNKNDVCAVFSNINQNQGFNYPVTTVNGGENEFIDFCKYYDNNSNLACHECFNQSPDVVDNAQRRVLLVDNINSTSGSKCVQATQLGKCRIAKTQNNINICLECYDNHNVFLKLRGAEQVCEIVTPVENCKNYFLTQPKTDSECKDCLDGYYLKDKLCHKGYVPQCKVYKTDGSRECTECNSGYILHPTKKYCFLNNFDTDCTDVSFPNPFEVQCDTCNKATQAKVVPVKATVNGVAVDDKFNVQPVGASNSTDHPLSQCVQSNPIPNCATLNQDTDNSLIFQCTKCNDGYFLNEDEDSYFCQERSNKQNECKTYVHNLDQCQECIDKYWLDVNKKCQPNPIGTRNCLIFEDGNKCVKCKENHYLDSTNDLCIQVVLNPEVVIGCKFYTNATTCNECDPGLFLDVVNNKCLSPTLTQPDNCAVYQSVSSCKTCDNGYHPDSTGKCVENGVTFCDVYDQVAKRCTKCQGDKYLTFNTDTQKQECATSTVIQGCEFYSAQDKCQLCDSKNYLNTLGKCETLKSFMDDNCSVTEETADFQCFLCKQGYYFKDGACTAFTDNSFSQGCSWANPVKPSECIICSVNHYMNTQGTCVSTVTNTTTTDDSLGLVKLCMFVLSVLFFQL